MGDPRCDVFLTPWTPDFLHPFPPTPVPFAFFFLSCKAARKKKQTGFISSPVPRERRCRPRQAAEALRPACGGGCGAASSRLPRGPAGAPEARSLPALPVSRIPSAGLAGGRGPAGGSAKRGVGGGCRLGAGIPSRLTRPWTTRAGTAAASPRPARASRPFFGSERDQKGRAAALGERG